MSKLSKEKQTELKKALAKAGVKTKKNGVDATLSFSNFEEMHFVQHNLCMAIHELSLYAENEPNNNAAMGIRAISEVLRQMQNGCLHRGLDKILSSDK